MIADGIKIKGYTCFKNSWAGLDKTKPVNVVIGRNNSGKSHFLNLIEALCEGTLKGKKWRYKFSGILDEDSLKSAFREGVSAGILGGNHWQDHGRRFLGVRITWEADEQLNPLDIMFPDSFDPASPHGVRSSSARMAGINEVAKGAEHSLSGKTFRRLLADRDVKPEPPQKELGLEADGTGATNIVRRFIVSSNSRFPHETIQKELLNDLNTIFAKDGRFTEIQVRLHDENSGGKPEDLWEIFLGEEKKGLIPLSSSGSGLKTVILVLLNLLVVPAIERVSKHRSEYVFAFEELENNLHPSLLRRLLRFLEEYAVREKAIIFLTTHSSAALDLFGGSENAQIIHVTHDGETAHTETVSAHFDHLAIVSELGAKPSDLLQANGIIWVEGPSDCIYINRWIHLFTDGRVKEGRDYQCAFYGGALLARTQFVSPEVAEAELVNLFRVNPNIVVICDGDRTGKGSGVKDRVRRIRAEVKQIPGAHVWVTGAREIENYIPGDALSKALGLASVPDPGQYELFFPRKGAPGNSFIESKLGRKGLDKVELAVQSAVHMNKSDMVQRIDWEFQMQQIVDRIQAWNR